MGTELSETVERKSLSKIENWHIIREMMRDSI